MSLILELCYSKEPKRVTHSFMQTLTNQKLRTVSRLLIGLNLHENM